MIPLAPKICSARDCTKEAFARVVADGVGPVMLCFEHMDMVKESSVKIDVGLLKPVYAKDFK